MNSSSVIKSLEDEHNPNPETALAYFYFTFREERKQSVDEMLRSLIKQLCVRRPDTDTLKTLVEDQEKGHHPDTGVLQKTLVSAIRGFTRVYIVLDALDECPSKNGDRDRLLTSLKWLYHAGCDTLHMLYTSRNEEDIKQKLNPLMPPLAAGGIDLEDYNAEDIGLHLDKIFSSWPFNSWTREIKDEARADLIEKSEGM